jgi:glutathione S-transferase
MRIVHHLENSRSLRVLWMLEELGLDYELRRYPRDPKTLLAPPEAAQRASARQVAGTAGWRAGTGRVRRDPRLPR